MTHRSRAGGPSHPRPKALHSKNQPKKLHHPPSASIHPPTSRDSHSHAYSPSPSLSPEDHTESISQSPPSDIDILNVIYHALQPTFDSEFIPTIQRIKSLLYDRKWLEVFENPDLLGIYAGRWVPSRALCFRELLASHQSIRALFTADVHEGDDEVKRDELERTTNILSLGGGAGSELLAICALIHGQHESAKRKEIARTGWKWTAMDIGAWQSTLDTFRETIRTQWEIGGILTTEYIRGDLLDSTHCSLSDVLTKSPPELITLLFTLTELLTQSRTQTISLLHLFTASTSPGCLFLVADSASDISSFEIGSQGRKYPVYFVLDTLLLGQGGWEILHTDDSRWYRLPEGVGVDWPVKLENTRYWMRLYRRI